METEIVQYSELLDCFKRSFDGRKLQETRQDYIPPIIVNSGALLWLSRTLEILAEVASPSETLSLSAYYVDDRDRRACHLVLSLEMELSPDRQPLVVDTIWADKVGFAQHELIAHSVNLKYCYDRGSLHCNFEFPIFGYAASAVKHRNCILLVEDDAFVRNSTREILEAEGYRVLTADCAENGLKTFQRSSGEVGLVITDLTMPGLDGRSLAKSIRKEDQRVPILFISGFGVTVMENPGAHTYFLAKPYSARTLMSSIARCFRGYHEVNAMSASESESAATAWL